MSGVDSRPVIWGAQAIRSAVSFEDLVDPVAAAFKDASAGKIQSGLITMFPAGSAEQGDVYVKTGAAAGGKVHIVKISPWFAINVQRNEPQGGFVAVMDSTTGHTIGLLDDQHYLSDVRTAAAGAVAARLLAPKRVRVATVLGAGVQALLQPLALHRERPFDRLLVWARNLDKASGLVSELRRRLPSVDVTIERNIERAVRLADVLMTTTSSRSPLVRGDWIRSGTHITAVGADDATKCELDSETLRRGKVFVDSRDAARLYGDVHRAIAIGGYELSELSGEIGEALLGSIAGRSNEREITIAKFVGIGAQDLVAAEIAMQRLRADHKA